LRPNRPNRRAINFGTSTTVTGIVIICHQTPPDDPGRLEIDDTHQQGLLKQTQLMCPPERSQPWEDVTEMSPLEITVGHPGDRTMRQELRLILKNSGLSPAGELFDRAYAYISENY
jgi:hypothetical protein